MKSKIVKSSVDKLDVASIKKLARFYFAYTVKNRVILPLFIGLIISFVVLFAILINSKNYLNYSLLLISPFIAISTIFGFLVPWKVNSATNHDGTSLFVYSKKVGRNNAMFAKYLVSFIVVSPMLFAQALLSLIFNFAIGIPSGNSFLFSIVAFLAALFLLMFLISLSMFITTLFSNIFSTIFLAILSMIFIVIPVIGGRIISKQGNELSWEANNFKENYAKLYELDVQNEVANSEIVVYNAGNQRFNSNDEMNGNIGNSGASLFVDKIVTSPFSLFISPTTFVDSEHMRALSNDHAFSLINLSDEYKSDISKVNLANNLVTYSIDDENPIDSPYSKVKDKLISNFTRDWDSTRFGFDINDSVLMSQLLSRISSDPKWISTLLTDQEKKFISKLIGFSKEDALLFYVFRDWPIFSSKYGKIFEDLRNAGLNKEFVSVLEYIFTNQNVRDNILNQYMIQPQEKIEDLFPMNLAYDYSKLATFSDVKKMKDLISTISTSEVSILTENGYHKIPRGNLLQTLHSKAEYDSMVENNSELLNLKKLYEEIINYVKSNSLEKIQEVKFNKNSTDIYKYEKIIEIRHDANIGLSGGLFAGVLISTCAMTSFTFILNKRKDVK